eukprot:1322352-Amphidinium_carterae.1
MSVSGCQPCPSSHRSWERSSRTTSKDEGWRRCRKPLLRRVFHPPHQDGCGELEDPADEALAHQLRMLHHGYVEVALEVL